ncbi:MAG: YggS family pyridoxal phosphate-dependent enzyme [Gemmatimonadota bacterium]
MVDARLRENLARVVERIERARDRAGHIDPVTLVAVTKGHAADVVRSAAAVGLEHCGENRVAELEEKIEEVGRYAVTWHLIGHLQRNKVRRALSLFDLVHSIDSERLANEVSAEAVRVQTTVPSLIQVNVTGEETKGGFNAVTTLEPALDAIGRVLSLPGLAVQGLMTMAPLTDDEGTLHKTFARARDLFERSAQLSGFGAQYLSMGMSNDFEIAVEEGSTMVRLGTILFGERQR